MRVPHRRRASDSARTLRDPKILVDRIASNTGRSGGDGGGHSERGIHTHRQATQPASPLKLVRRDAADRRHPSCHPSCHPTCHPSPPPSGPNQALTGSDRSDRSDRSQSPLCQISSTHPSILSPSVAERSDERSFIPRPVPPPDHTPAVSTQAPSQPHLPPVTLHRAWVHPPAHPALVSPSSGSPSSGIAASSRHTAYEAREAVCEAGVGSAEVGSAEVGSAEVGSAEGGGEAAARAVAAGASEGRWKATAEVQCEQEAWEAWEALSGT